MTTALARGLSPLRTVLDNGAVVLVQETATTPAVTLLATFLAGSLYDPPDLPGAAYLTAHVLDRGTERRTAREIAEALDDRGVALQVSTTRHTLSIGCTCLATDFDDLLEIVLDVARRPVFPEAEIARRRGEIVTAVLQDEDNPAVRASQALMALLYGADHPYARPAKGTPRTLDAIGRGHLVALHEARMRPAALTVTVVGDVRQQHVVERAALELDGWYAPPPVEAAVPPVPRPGSRQVQMIEMPGKAQSDIAYGFTAVRRLDPRYYAYWVMNNVLGEFGLGGRIADNIRERQGLAYYAFSALDANVSEGPLVARVGVDPGNVGRALRAIDDEVGRLGGEGPTAAELEASRQYLIGSIARMFETNYGIAAFLQQAEQFGLGLDYDRRLPAYLREVTQDDVARAAAELLRPDRAAVAVAGPAARDLT